MGLRSAPVGAKLASPGRHAPYNVHPAGTGFTDRCVHSRDSFGILSHPLRGFGALRYLPLFILRQVIIIGIHFSFPLLSATIVYCYIFPIVCLYDQSFILLNFQKPVTGIEPVSTAWKAAMRSEFLTEFLSHLLRRFEVPFTTRTLGREVPVIIIRKLFPYASLPVLCCNVLQL